MAAVAIAYGIWQVAAAPKWTVDDAFITFRYAQNLALHGELNWNVGQDPVEGYTGVLWPLMLAAAIWMGASPVVVSQVLGVVGWAVALFLADDTLRRLDSPRPIRAAVMLLLCASPMMVASALAGLETQAFVAAVLACQWALVREFQRSESRQPSIALPVTLLLAGLVRPEGALAGPAAAAIYMALAAGTDRPRRVRFLLRFGLWYGLPALTYFLWRWSYYGRLLPNSFYAKNLDEWNTLKQVPAFLGFLEYYLAYPAAACAAVKLLSLLTRRNARPIEAPPTARRTALAAVAFATLLSLVWCLQYLRTDPVMNYAHRYYAPVLALALTAMGALFHGGSARGAQPRPHGGVGRFLPLIQSCATAAAVTVLFLLHGGKLTQETWWRWKEMILCLYQLVDQTAPAATFVRQHVPGDEWLAVHIDAGLLGYVPGLRTLDMGRLNDEFLAQPDLTQAQWADYFFQHNPAALVLTSWDRSILNIHGEGGRAVVDDPRFAAYRRAAEFPTSITPDYRQLVYLRSDVYARYLETRPTRRSTSLAQAPLAAEHMPDGRFENTSYGSSADVPH